MYNFIRKNVVVAVIKWLKENNQLYSEVEINDSWADDWLSSEFATLVHEENENVIENNDNIAGDDDGVNDNDDGDNNDDNNIKHYELSEENAPDNEISEEDRELIEDHIATEASLQVKEDLQLMPYTLNFWTMKFILVHQVRIVHLMKCW